MKGIILSQLYKIRRDKLCIFAFVAILVFSGLLMSMVFSGVGGDVSSAFDGGEFSTLALTMFSLIAQFFTYVFVAQTSGIDFKDKTCNYEIMAGHTRFEVFFGRAIPCVILATLGTLTLISAPIIAYSLLFGWGDTVSLSDMTVRILMLAFPIMRICCEYIFLTYLIKNPYIVMGISYVVSIMLVGNIPQAQVKSPILGMTSINMLTTIDSWVCYGLSNEIYHTYETALMSEDIITIIVVSLIFAAGSLLLGYIFFKKDDIH